MYILALSKLQVTSPLKERPEQKYVIHRNYTTLDLFKFTLRELEINKVLSPGCNN